jgi:hypothetical protein
MVRGCSSDSKSPQVAKVTVHWVKRKFWAKKPTHEPIYKDKHNSVKENYIHQESNQSKVNSWEWKN